MKVRVRFSALAFVCLLQAFGVGQTLEFGPAFSNSPEELTDFAATRSTGDSSIDVLVDEGIYTYDEDAGLTTEHHQIYQVLSRQSARGNPTIQTVWRPWIEEEPVLRARVIGKNGQVHKLDRKTIEKIRIPAADPRIHTDQILLRAPLPAVKKGSLVETQVVMRKKIRCLYRFPEPLLS